MSFLWMTKVFLDVVIFDKEGSPTLYASFFSEETMMVTSG